MGAIDTTSLGRAVSLLGQLATERSKDPVAMNDFAVALVAAADQWNDAMAYLRALDVLGRAIAIDSGRPEIRYNYALLLERLHLRASAQAAWLEVAKTEPIKEWRLEAQRHAAARLSAESSFSWGDSTAGHLAAQYGEDSAAALAARDPLAARDFALRGWSQWAEELSRGQAARAVAIERQVASVGSHLAEAGLDGSLRLDAGELNACRRGREHLARLGGAINLHLAGGYDDAAGELSVIERGLRSHDCPLWRWTAFYRASAELNRSRYDVADRALDDAIVHTRASEPALMGKLVWAQGVTQLRRGHYEMAAKLYRESHGWLERSHEEESVGGVSYLLTEALLFAGRIREASDEAIVGIKRLAPFRRSGYLNNHLTNVGVIARQSGLTFAALSIADEVVVTSRGVGRPQVISWALRNRARDFLRLGLLRKARTDLRAARSVAEGMRPGVGRDRILADIDLTLAEALRGSDPDSARVLLSDVVTTYRRLNLANHLPTALTQAGLHALAQGDTVSGAMSLRAALSLVEQQGRRFESNDLRVSLASSVDSVYDALISLELARQNPLAALDLLARAQMMPWIGLTSVSVPKSKNAPDWRNSIRADEAVLAYVLLPTKVGVWVGRGTLWQYRDLPSSRHGLDSLVSMVAAVDGRPAMSRIGLQGLYATLIRPVEPLLTGATRLIVVADRALTRVPFAALWDAESHRFLIEDREVVSLPALELLAGKHAEWRKPKGAYVYSGMSTLAGLAPLLGAQAEAGEIAAAYRTRAQTRGTVLNELEKARGMVFHFAGHAVNDQERPERSFLALEDTIRLTAAAISASTLQQLPLVVLSACSTQGTVTNGRGGANGLASSFLVAGARAVIGTQWDIEDEQARKFQRQLHEELRAGKMPGEALRSVQMSHLSDPDARASAPSVWGAYALSGR